MKILDSQEFYKNPIKNPKIISKINFLKPCKVSVGVKVLSALIRVYLDNKSFNLHDSTCVRTVMRLAFKRTSNNMHTTSRKNLIAIFRQGVPLISYRHDRPILSTLEPLERSELRIQIIFEPKKWVNPCGPSLSIMMVRN